MSEPNPEKRFEDIIRDKALAEDAAPEWLMAYAMMRLAGTSRDISRTLKETAEALKLNTDALETIRNALDERDTDSTSLSERLNRIGNLLDRLLRGKHA